MALVKHNNDLYTRWSSCNVNFTMIHASCSAPKIMSDTQLRFDRWRCTKKLLKFMSSVASTTSTTRERRGV